jgi:hypothetical protein
MSQIVLDEGQLAAANGLRSTVEVTDAKGEFVGYLISKKQLDKYMYAWAREEISDEELEKLAQEDGEIPHEEVMKHLQELADNEIQTRLQQKS